VGGTPLAYPEGIRQFASDEDIAFTECRRCPAQVIALANALVGRDPDRVKSDLEPVEGAVDGEVHHVRFRTADDETDGVAAFVARRIEQDCAGAGDCLVLVNSRRHARRIRRALIDRGVAAETFFREEALDTEAAREAITLLTLRLNEDDRVAQRAWLGIDQQEARSPAYRRIWAEADTAGITVAEAMARIKAGDLKVPNTHKAVERWDELMTRLAELEPIGDDLEAMIDALVPGFKVFIRCATLPCSPYVRGTMPRPSQTSRCHFGTPSASQMCRSTPRTFGSCRFIGARASPLASSRSPAWWTA
jgi:superfamily I DNA/RNA helicase